MPVLIQFLAKEQSKEAASLAQNKASPRILEAYQGDQAKHVNIVESMRHNLLITGKHIDRLMCFICIWLNFVFLCFLYAEREGARIVITLLRITL